ncbi:deoxynucleoside kinase [Lewinella sp. 4G2]|uniref:deoxynucleoside kinase n=1 Tax=Lewinella sp. 4G2 TaxID=1803372 RepID=UPI0007B4B1A3|nr:deoxynucleoside kinase [Lewinella sp. 4G2]OAV45371.1 deoxynucleoside kinase [Lewinella sp. 4G2]
MSTKTLPNFIAVEGNIGAGKTTFATRLAKEENRRLILESFADNPFLPPFYEDQERYGFPVELFFMAERHKQLSAELARADLFSNGTIADYIFVKTLLFARNTLNEEEFRLFTRIFKTMDAGFPDPDLIVYLHRPVNVLQQQIAKRGRSYEQDIQNDYLASVQQAYTSYFGTQKDTPVLILKLGSADFMGNQAVYQKMKDAISNAATEGVTTIEIAS